MAGRKNAVALSSSVLVLLVCLTGVVLAQTFQYSRGWTNGKKRAGGVIPRVFQEQEGPDVLGVCQMLRLREIMAQKKREQVTKRFSPIYYVLAYSRVHTWANVLILNTKKQA